MPVNKYALLRYRIIDKCIRNKYKPYPSIKDLQKTIEEALYGSEGQHVSISTIEKDLNAMRNENELGYFAPIKFNKHHGGYYYEDSNYSIDKIPLSGTDLEALNLAINTLNQFKDVKMFSEVGDSLTRLLDRFHLSTSGQENLVGHYVQFENSPAAAGGEHLSILLKAIQLKQKVLFNYQSFIKASSKQHLVSGYLLKEYRNRWYLLGWDDEKNMILTFGLDRLRNLSLTSHTYAYPTDFNTDLYFKYSIGITANQQAPEIIELQFEARIGQYIKSQPIHHTQQIIHDTPEYLTISLKLLPSPELYNQILSWGESVKVLSPTSIRDEMVKKLSMALKSYEKR